MEVSQWNLASNLRQLCHGRRQISQLLADEYLVLIGFVVRNVYFYFYRSGICVFSLHCCITCKVNWINCDVHVYSGNDSLIVHVYVVKYYKNYSQPPPPKKKVTSVFNDSLFYLLGGDGNWNWCTSICFCFLLYHVQAWYFKHIL